jgi:L-fucose isomerase-like protein
VAIIKKSFKELGKKAKEIPDSFAEKVISQREISDIGLSNKALYSAVKMYLAVKEDIDNDENIKGAGINCLNESFYSDSTPCLAWSMLYEDRGLIWACEADISSLMSMYLINQTTDAKIMMSNIYPFLMGMSALKHERIDKFPQVNDPQNYALIVHCGYFGVVPRPFCSSWKVVPKVLDIVDDNAIALDARLPEGNITISKLDPTLNELMVIEAEIEKYVQYPGSHCRNGALVRVPDGYKMMELFNSHHNCFMMGHQGESLKNVARVFNLEIKSA